MAKKQRVVFEVSYSKKTKAWNGTQTKPKRPIIAHWNNYPKKAELVKAVVEKAKSLRANDGTPSQVVIKGRNGRMQAEYTYGNDPRRTPG